MYCKAVCLQIEEADLNCQPDRVVQQHLDSCEDCRAFQEERKKLRQLVNSLGTVQAPADFDFRLRARLANQSSAGRFWMRGTSFGWPSAAVAALVLIVGAVFVFRTPSEPPARQTAVVHTASEPASTVDATTTSRSEDSFTPLAKAPTALQRARSESAVTGRPQFASGQRRLASREYSSVAAKVVKPEDTVASADAVFTIYGSDEPMRLSLDDGSGVQRTISLPRISFGSQRAFATEHTSMVKTSAKGVW